MTNAARFLLPLLFLLVTIPALTFSQTNAEKIKTKWVVEKLEPEKNIQQAEKAALDIPGLCLTFNEDELVITRKTEFGDSVVKKGGYLLSGNFLTIGKDQATILLLSDTHLTLKIPGQGVLYLRKVRDK